MKLTKKQKKKLLLIIASLFLLGAAIAADLIWKSESRIKLLLYLPAYLLIGYDVILSAVKGIGRGQIFDEVFLMSVATLGAFAIGEYTEGCAVMIFFKIGELFELTASQNARKAISLLAKSCPDLARVVRDGKMLETDVNEVKIGETVFVRPGERVPVDAVIISEGASFDSSSITGESLPVFRQRGESVMSGYICIDRPIEARAIAVYEDSASARVLKLMESASLKKARSERLITRFSLVYTPAVVFSAIALAVIPPLMGLGSFAEFIERALTFLVVSCPCALVISVPLTYFTAVGRAAKSGVIFKSNSALESLSGVRGCAMDKTGTVTSGEFSVEEVKSYGMPQERVLGLAASLEVNSVHPIARAIVREAERRAVSIPCASEVEEKRGIGMAGCVDNVKLLAVRPSALVQMGIECPDDVEGASEVCIVYGGRLVGIISACDSVKNGAAGAVSDLSELGVELYLLTGDNPRAAYNAAEKAGIKNVRAGLLPEDKVMIAQELSQKGGLLFVGDGLNDAPVMAMASVSAAMGAIGSDAAIEAADIVVCDDKLEKIPFALRLARSSDRIVKQNIVFALGVKLAVLVLGAFGITGLWWAVFADVGVSVIAILNSMRTSRIKD